MYFRLWGRGAVWIERREQSWSFEMSKEDGEWFVWLGRWHVIFTPPKWQPKRAKVALKMAA